MSSTGFTSGYQSLLNLSTFDNIDVINASSVTVNGSLTLPYINKYAVLETDVSSNVIGQNLTNGQIIIGSTNAQPIASTITGTTDQISVAIGTGSITLSLPQNIDTGATVTFGNITDSGLTASELVATDGSKKLESVTISNTNANGTNNTLSFAGSTLTLGSSMSQNLSTSGSPSFANISDTGVATGNLLMTAPSTHTLIGIPASDGSLAIGGTIDGYYTDATITGSSNITVANGSHSITLDTIQPITTSSTPTFANIIDSGLTASELVATNGSKQLESVSITNSNGVLISFSGSTLACTLDQDLTFSGTPSFGEITDTGLTPNELVATSGFRTLQSVSITNSNANGTNNSLSYAGGTLTLASSMSQDVSSSGTPSFSNITDTGVNAMSMVNVNNSQQLVATSINNSSNGVVTTLSANALSISTPQDVRTTASPSFEALTLTNTTNQLALGTTNVVTIDSVAPTSSYTLTIPDSYQTFTPTNFITSSCRTNQYAVNFFYSPIYSATYSTTTTVSAHDINKGVTYCTPSGAITLTTDTGTAINNEIGNGSSPPFNNMSIRWMVMNNSQYAVTLAAGVGVTFESASPIVLPYSTEVYIVHCDSSTTCSIYGGGVNYQQTVSTAFTGAIPSTNVNITYVRSGNIVTCNFAGTGSVNATSSTTISSAAAVPSNFRPNADIWYLPNMQTAAASFVNGLVWISSGGNITFYANGAQANFANGNAIVLRSFCTTWLAAV